MARLALVVAGLVSTLLPAALHLVVEHRLHARVEPALTRALAVPVTIDRAEAGLTGALRLDGVRVGRAFSARSVEAGTGWRALLAGTFSADEIRIDHPRVRASLRPGGGLDVEELLTRARDARRRASRVGAPGPGRTLRRIVVTGGELVVELAGHGELRLAGVEILPETGGARVLARGAAFALDRAGLALSGRMGATAVDLALPALRPRRLASGGGTIALAGAGAELVLEEVAIAQGVEGDGARLDARVAATGAPLSVTAARDGAGSWRVDLVSGDVPLAALALLAPHGARLEHATASGTLALWRAPSGDVRASGSIAARRVTLDHPLLANEPFALDAELSGELTWQPRTAEGHASLRAASGGITVTAEVDGGIARGGALARASLWAELGRTPCAALLAAVPRPLRAPLDGIDLSGELAARLDVAFDTARPDATRLDVDLDNRCRVERDPLAADVNALRGAPVHTLPGGERRVLAGSDPAFVSLAPLPGHVPGAFVAAEDARFYAHDGFDLEQLQRSFAIDVAEGRVARGGSTISQQLVKNLYLTRDRTLSRKLLEAVLTWRLEQRVSKPRILEAYLNLIELGEGVYGLRPAARRWFGKEPGELDVVEAAFLAALTPAPVSTDRRLRGEGRLDDRTAERVRTVLRAMRRARVLDRDAYDRAAQRVGDLALRL